MIYGTLIIGELRDCTVRQFHQAVQGNGPGIRGEATGHTIWKFNQTIEMKSITAVVSGSAKASSRLLGQVFQSVKAEVSIELAECLRNLLCDLG